MLLADENVFKLIQSDHINYLTNAMEGSSSWEATIRPATQESPKITELEGSLPCSQEVELIILLLVYIITMEQIDPMDSREIVLWNAETM
jgi:hypothetical protein